MRWVALVLGALALGALTTSLVVGSQPASGSSTATIRIGDATIEPAGDEVITLEALNVDVPGVCAVTVDIAYDAAVKMAMACDADPQNLFDTALCNVTTPGTISFAAIKAAGGVTRNFPLADITWHGEGDPGECTLVDLTVATFADCEGIPIEHTTDDGENCIASPSPLPTPTPGLDDDGDGLPNSVDPCPNDDDCDDDGLMDGSASSEDLNDNGVVDPGETDPTNWDSDGDGLSDGLERGLIVPEGQDTDTTSPHWQPDADPTTKTDPLSVDTNADGVPDGEEDLNRNGRVDASETDPSLVAVSLAQGWKHTCYVGEGKPIDQALGGAANKVLAVYRLKSGQTFDRWFPGRPNVSTIATVGPWDQLFVLASEATTWNQQFSGVSQGSVTLAPGWNSVCYSGATKDMETAIAGISGQIGAIYALQPDQTWARYVPGRPNISTLTQAVRLGALLVLVTQEGGTTWVFDP